MVGLEGSETTPSCWCDVSWGTCDVSIPTCGHTRSDDCHVNSLHGDQFTGTCNAIVAGLVSMVICSRTPSPAMAVKGI